MRQTDLPGQFQARRLNLRILAVFACICFLSGAISLFDPLELIGQVVRFRLRAHPPSGQVVVVAIDDASAAAYGTTPWPKARVGELAEKIHNAGARRIALDFANWGVEDRAADARFEQTLQRIGRDVVLPTYYLRDPLTGKASFTAPTPREAQLAQVADSKIVISWDGVAHKSAYSSVWNGKPIPSIASLMAGVRGDPDERFLLDYAINLRALPIISASDILSGRWKPEQVRGKDIVIGENTSTSQRWGAISAGQIPMVFIHAEAIETLRGERPADGGWFVPVSFALFVAATFLFWRRRPLARLVLLLGVMALLVVPVWADSIHYNFTIMPALFLLLGVAATRLCLKVRHSLRTKGMTNAVSGLPNLNALRAMSTQSTAAIVVARMQNFAEVITALPSDCEKDLVEQVVNRLEVGTHGNTIYQADDGLFIWVAEAVDHDLLDEQLMALHALFRSPVVVAGRLVDLSVSFGLDTDTSRPLVQRVSSAFVAADRAATEGRRWMTYDPAELEDAEWKMSLLARLDQAVERGEIWVAYQPKIDLATGEIVGAEALARWTHPQKGDIPPSQFIPAAERSGRIENLTAYVLDQAIAATAAISRGKRPGFQIAVNLSARLLDGPDLIPLVTRALARYRLPPHQLILEVTETAAMTSQEGAFAALQALSAAGVRLSIDDYGTGFSTLDYLKRIPADEIKIDRSFVSMLEKSQSDRIMVHSTIQLAHSLGRKAVAEGVENGVVLNELRLMQCDYVQGYFTGKPMTLQALMASIPPRSKIVAA